jgi:hypothetical protein
MGRQKSALFHIAAAWLDAFCQIGGSKFALRFAPLVSPQSRKFLYGHFDFDIDAE